MQILAIDIGLGTSDYLLFDSNESNPENYLKLILPSPTKQFANIVKKLDKDLFINGYIIGGGLINKALKQHLKKYNVFISKNAARTISDDIDEIISDGFNIVEDIVNPDITLTEIDSKTLNFINSFPNGNFTKLVVAAQDHGFEKGKSDREVRINFLKDFLKKGLTNAKFEKTDVIPEKFTRWNSLKQQLENLNIPDYAISDTSVVASLGAAYTIKRFPAITIDIGNGHTFAALIDEKYNILAFFEHHTSKLTKENLFYFLEKLVKFELTHEEVFEDRGHGAHVFSKIDNLNFQNIKIYATGPRRNELLTENDQVIFANPFGDVMITGPVGLLMQQNVI